MISAWWLLLFVAAWWGLFIWQSSRVGHVQDKLKIARRELEELQGRLERRSERLDTLFSNVNEAILRLDARGMVLAANERARAAFHMTDSLELPQSLTVLYRHPDWHRALRQALERLPEPSALPDMEMGDVVLAVRLTPLGRDQALLLCLDISRQRQLEVQREQLIRDLMHDMKTPLTSILGYARSIESFGDDATIREEASQTIAREAKRLNRLLESLLTLDQLERGRGDGEGVSDLTAVADDVCNLMRQVAETASVRIETAFTPGSEQFPMSSEHLHRLLTNLVDNAIRYSPKGGRVSLTSTISGASIFLSVTDEGAGIEPAALSRVTERFYRADNARVADSGGHGLGLAIVAETVNRYGGRLELSNRETGGLEVQVRLPYVEGKGATVTHIHSRRA